nr:hypothetical protein CFP56_03310 [Quercus suber]
MAAAGQRKMKLVRLTGVARTARSLALQYTTGFGSSRLAWRHVWCRRCADSRDASRCLEASLARIASPGAAAIDCFLLHLARQCIDLHARAAHRAGGTQVLDLVDMFPSCARHPAACSRMSGLKDYRTSTRPRASQGVTVP